MTKKAWLREVRFALLKRFIWGREARRLLNELQDHYEASVSSLKKEGLEESLVEERALSSMGNPQQIAKVAAEELHPILLQAKQALLVVLALLVPLALFSIWLHWSGDRELAQAQEVLLAKGEKLNIKELVPPAPPEADNFFADPLWMEFTVSDRKDSKFIDPKKRQLSQWESVPLSSQEILKLKEFLPSSGDCQRREAARNLFRSLKEQKDPQKQREEATLLLGLIAPSQLVLDRIAELSMRSGASFPVPYELGPSTPLPEITAMMNLSQILSEKAFSELILGKNREAASDVLTLLRLSTMLRNEPILITSLVSLSMASLGQEAINVGLQRHAWTDPELNQMQRLLEPMDFKAAYLFALRGERLTVTLTTTKQIKELPRGVILPPWVPGQAMYAIEIILSKNKALNALLIQRQLDSLASTMESGWNNASGPSMIQELEALTGKNPFNKLIYALEYMSIPAFSNITQKCAECQTQIEQCLIACSLERYRIARGTYPASLDALTPEYLAKLPNSPITGQAMSYSLQPDGTFLLWTPGWNLKSLGGKAGEFRGDGDIVWNQPLPKKPKESSKAAK
jgi:hypothetical protein